MEDGIGASAERQVSWRIQDRGDADPRPSRPVSDEGAAGDSGGSEARARESAWPDQEAGPQHFVTPGFKQSG